jgi:circadian clock protein KaiB
MASNAGAEHSQAGDGSASTELWRLRLYVAGRTPRSVKAFENLKRVCETSLGGHYAIEVVDLHDHPSLAVTDQVLAVPTVVRMMPPPPRRVIGDLSDKNRVLAGLGVERRHTGQPPQ